MGGNEGSCVCDLIMSFFPPPACCKSFHRLVQLTFLEHKVGPPWGAFRELFACGCLLTVCRRQTGERRERWKCRKTCAVFDQRDAESHWDVMESLVFCNRGEGREGD